ncbi:LEAF RUST 10 DISEASE-RESISTANCE LOCUS RECEPTOR-LIKE PROTEIN KINASE-like 2.1 [Ziziphus jujuba]|uniref:non-specific serine/threonine protein kinase n=1 Tax=Ziziphus jujuba TaxID=326968 RepID=A0A6P6GJR1_ZIZJJ|nr:LEAF RUST 10 DISEASE-RESISTANCE LOCUS RECEPTOR-LIKE PROTEIN KINASE-like 2.1 [Ziziphus jujuba]
MNQNLFFFFFLFSPWILNLSMFTFFLLFSDINGAVNPSYQACSSIPRTCGDNQTISFPFYIQSQQESFCGYPGFELSCNGNGHPILNLSNDNYIIHQFSYQNQFLLVSNAAFSNPPESCIPPLQNLTLASEMLELPKQNQVFLLYNCRPPRVPKYEVGCSSKNQSNWVLGLSGNDSERVGNLSRSCGDGMKLVVAPVKEEYVNGNESGTGIREGVSRGLELKWKVNYDCKRCEKSGGICGFNSSISLYQCYCKDRPHRVRCHYDNGKGKSAVTAIVASTVAGIAALVVIVICCIRKIKFYNKPIFFWKKQNQTDRNVEAFLRTYGPVQVRRYSYLDVKKMTNSFKETLGHGGYGGVYKGYLKDGSPVAVKLLMESKGNGEEFVNEVSSISRTSHVNIVSLLGYCYESRKRALIYEFMPNGSLEKYIFNNNHPLEWETLFRISLGIARGLEYLHRGCNTPILHFDIKPHNILLDEDFSPKIADFGLARVCTRKESMISISNARGTAGYIAPEVFCKNFGGVSHKSDVYSYGMMVLDMVGGRENVNVGVEHQTSELYFPRWIYKRLELEEELGLQRIMNEVERIQVKKMIIVSLWCIQTDPSHRPAMREVIEMLEGSLDSLQMPPKPFSSSSSASPSNSSTFFA